MKLTRQELETNRKIAQDRAKEVHWGFSSDWVAGFCQNVLETYDGLAANAEVLARNVAERDEKIRNLKTALEMLSPKPSYSVGTVVFSTFFKRFFKVVSVDFQPFKSHRWEYLDEKGLRYSEPYLRALNEAELELAKFFQGEQK